MALATQCPHCHTTFRVAHDQLKLRAGLVRCGACKQIFNGIENLLRPGELEQAKSPASAPQAPQPQPAVPPARPPAPAFEETAVAGDTAVAAASTVPAAEPQDETRTEAGGTTEATGISGDETAAEEQTRQDPLLRMTLMDFTHEQRETAAVDDAEARPHHADEPDTIDDLQNKPWRSVQEGTEEEDELDRADAAGYEEPAFVKQGRRRQRIGRVMHMLMAIGSVLLLLSLIAQAGYVFRNQVAAWFPQAKPVLAQACAYIGCQVGLPEQIDSVSIESSELQTLAANGNTFALTVLLRNHDATVQAWPHIELTLNDAAEKPIARRVFQPLDYLGSEPEVRKGFGPKSEQPVKLYFELARLKASGYRVYLFYP